MKKLKAFAYKYHRQLGIIFSLPLALCAVTGIGMAVADEFLHNKKLAHLFFGLHTMKIFKSEEIEMIYTFIVCLSLLGLIFTGLIMLMPINKNSAKK